METLRAAARGGAEAIVLCDTNGGTLPWEIEAARRAPSARRSARRIGIHAHDDAGCGSPTRSPRCAPARRTCRARSTATASAAATRTSARSSPNLELKMGVRCLRDGRARRAHAAVALQSPRSRTSRPTRTRRTSAAARSRTRAACTSRRSAGTRAPYEHVDPALVGNRDARRRERAVGARQRAREGRGVRRRRSRRAPTSAVLRDVKEREARGFAFEAAEASVALMMRRESAGLRAAVRARRLQGHRRPARARGGRSPRRRIKIRVRGEIVHTAAEGNGPVSALDAALRKALVARVPGDRAASASRTTRSASSTARAGTAAIVARARSTPPTARSAGRTVGASPNILEASWLALADGIEYGLALASAARDAAEKGAA